MGRVFYERLVKVEGEQMITRRQLLKAAGTLLGYSFLVGPAKAQPRRTVTMLHQSHFVPAFNPELERQVTAWAAQRGVAARIDFLASRDIPARIAAEAESKSGHDIVQLRAFDAALYRRSLIPLDDVATALEREHGPWLPIARYVGFVNGRWYGVPWYHWSALAVVNRGHLARLGMTVDAVAELDWNGFLAVAERLHRQGTPVGIAISQTFDSNDGLYPILWAFGGRTVNEKGEVVINSDETAAAVEYVKRLFRFMPRDVLGWDDAANNRFLLSGVGAWTPNAPSIWAVAKLQNLPIADQIDHLPLPRGPRGRFRSTNTLSLGVWNFSANVDLAKDLIRYLLRPENVARQVEASMGYNQPFLQRYTQLDYWRRERALRHYEPVRETLAVPGWPGPAGEGAQLAYVEFIVPQMFARAITGTPTSEAIRWAEQELKARYQR
ncbi:MAG: extracellular solute-binding protein [Sulfolobales archaeon]